MYVYFAGITFIIVRNIFLKMIFILSMERFILKFYDWPVYVENVQTSYICLVLLFSVVIFAVFDSFVVVVFFDAYDLGRPRKCAICFLSKS